MAEEHLLELRETTRHFRRLSQSEVDSGNATRLEFGQGFYLRPFEASTLFRPIDRPCHSNQTFRNDQSARRTIKVRESNYFYHAMKIFKCKIGHPIALLRRHGLDGFDNPAEPNLAAILSSDKLSHLPEANLAIIAS